jgi:dUTP pyrophosphatase
MSAFDIAPAFDLLAVYDRFMYLKIFVDGPLNLKNKYLVAADSHNKKIYDNIEFIDAGFDLFLPLQEDKPKEDDTIIKFYGPNRKDKNPVNKMDFKIKCAAQICIDFGKKYNTGYYIHPRSSLSKTQLRLANATGIMDAGYRGNIIGMFDVVNITTKQEEQKENLNYDYFVKEHDRLIQICAPSLMPIYVEIVNNLEDLGIKTVRGEGGFGSTGH